MTDMSKTNSVEEIDKVLEEHKTEVAAAYELSLEGRRMLRAALDAINAKYPIVPSDNQRRAELAKLQRYTDGE